MLLLLTVTLGSYQSPPSPDFIFSPEAGGCFIRPADLERSPLPLINLTVADLNAVAFPYLYDVLISPAPKRQSLLGGNGQCS